MSAPKVSVVVTCFNYGPYLRDAVESVLRNGFDDLEVLIMDDGSTDDSLAIARRLEAEDPRVTAITQENAGQPAIPRNRGIERARGEYVIALDADDRLGAGQIAGCVAALDADPAAGMAFPQILQEFGARAMRHEYAPLSVSRLAHANCLPCSTMFRRRAWEDAGGYNLNVAGYEDWDFWVGIAEAGWTGARADGAVFEYRMKDGGLYDRVKATDQQLKAKVVLNRPGMYSDETLAWAQGVLDGDPAALAVPNAPSVVPEFPRGDRPLSLATDRAQRADWYVDDLDLEGPWPDRSLAGALATVERLGFTRITCDGRQVGTKRGSDPRTFPVPFFSAGTPDAVRVHALADATETLLLAGALRTSAPLDGARTAAYCGTTVEALGAAVALVEEGLRAPGPVPADQARAVADTATIIRAQHLAAGDVPAAARAEAVLHAARRSGLEEARSTVVLAFADELAAEPSLLEAYAEHVAPGDDITLAIVADDTAALLRTISELGLEDESPDMLAIPAVPVAVDAVLSRRPHGDTPRLDESSLPQWRQVAAPVS